MTVFEEIKKLYDQSPTSLAPFAPSRVELAIIAYLQARADAERQSPPSEANDPDDAVTAVTARA